MSDVPPGTPCVDDAARLAALAAFGILDTPPERGFDDIVSLARRLCGVPVALVSLVDRDRQWFKARAGFRPPQTDLDSSICRYTLGEAGVLQIPDLTLDPRTRSNPLVTGKPSLRFYAGAPLRTDTGETLGSLCVIDHVPRPGGLSEDQVADLEALARQVMDQLVLRRAVAERDDALAEQRRFLAQRAALIETQDAVAAAGGDLDAVLATLVAGALRAVPSARGAAFGMLEGDEVVHGAALGILSGLAGTRAPAAGTLAGASIASGEALLVPDMGVDGRAAADAAATPGLRSCLAMPVTHGNRAVAALVLVSDVPDAFGDRDLYAALTFAGSASAGLLQHGEAEARRRASENERLLGLERGLLRAVLQQAPVGISIAHADGGALFNDRMTEMLGHGVGGAGDGRYAGYHALHRDGRPYGIMDYPTLRALRLGETVDNESMLYRNGRTGEVRAWRAHSSPVLGAGGETLAALSVFIDVEDEYRGREAAARLAAIAEQSGDFIGIADARGRVEYVNAAGRALVGLDAGADLSALAVRDFFLPDDVPTLEAEILPTVYLEGRWVGDLDFRHFVTGEPVPVHYNLFALRDPDGAIAGYATVSRDNAERKRAEALQDLLNRELGHRMKNLMAMVQAIASSTLRSVGDPARARDVLDGRLVALGKAHEVLLGGIAERAGLASVVRQGVGVHMECGGNVTLEGPEIEVGVRAALSLALTLHELTTNAVKYGALSVPGGRVTVTCGIDEDTFRMHWRETGGPPVLPPSRKGFGSRLIERGLSGQVGARIRLDYPASGATCAIEVPLAEMQATG